MSHHRNDISCFLQKGMVSVSQVARVHGIDHRLIRIRGRNGNRYSGIQRGLKSVLVPSSYTTCEMVNDEVVVRSR